MSTDCARLKGAIFQIESDVSFMGKFNGKCHNEFIKNDYK